MGIENSSYSSSAENPENSKLTARVISLAEDRVIKQSYPQKTKEALVKLLNDEKFIKRATITWDDDLLANNFGADEDLATGLLSKAKDELRNEGIDI